MVYIQITPYHKNVPFLCSAIFQPQKGASNKHLTINVPYTVYCRFGVPYTVGLIYGICGFLYTYVGIIIRIYTYQEMSGILRNQSLRITTNMCQLSSFEDSVNILLVFLNMRGSYRTGPKAPILSCIIQNKPRLYVYQLVVIIIQRFCK
jgi:hypothetical protein